MGTSKYKKSERWQRLSVSILAVLFLMNTIAYLIRGRLNYRNYWGGAVFVPFAIIILVLLILILWKWNKWEKVWSDEKGKHIDWPGDDWKKW